MFKIEFPNPNNKAPTVTIGASFTCKVFRLSGAALLHL